MIDNSSITKRIDAHLPDRLYEMDWNQVAEYLDALHLPLLVVLCTSSNVSPTCLGLNFPWVLLLHHINSDTQRRVLEMAPDCTYNTWHEYLNVLMMYRSMACIITTIPRHIQRCQRNHKAM